MKLTPNVVTNEGRHLPLITSPDYAGLSATAEARGEAVNHEERLLARPKVSGKSTVSSVSRLLAAATFVCLAVAYMFLSCAEHLKLRPNDGRLPRKLAEGKRNVPPSYCSKLFVAEQEEENEGGEELHAESGGHSGHHSLHESVQPGEEEAASGEWGVRRVPVDVYEDLCVAMERIENCAESFLRLTTRISGKAWAFAGLASTVVRLAAIDLSCFAVAPHGMESRRQRAIHLYILALENVLKYPEVLTNPVKKEFVEQLSEILKQMLEPWSDTSQMNARSYRRLILSAPWLADLSSGYLLLSLNRLHSLLDSVKAAEGMRRLKPAFDLERRILENLRKCRYLQVLRVGALGHWLAECQSRVGSSALISGIESTRTRRSGGLYKLATQVKHIHEVVKNAGGAVLLDNRAHRFSRRTHLGHEEALPSTSMASEKSTSAEADQPPLSSTAALQPLSEREALSRTRGSQPSTQLTSQTEQRVSQMLQVLTRAVLAAKDLCFSLEASAYLQLARHVLELAVLELRACAGVQHSSRVPWIQALGQCTILCSAALSRSESQGDSKAANEFKELMSQFYQLHEATVGASSLEVFREEMSVHAGASLVASQTMLRILEELALRSAIWKDTASAIAGLSTDLPCYMMQQHLEALQALHSRRYQQILSMSNIFSRHSIAHAESSSWDVIASCDFAHLSAIFVQQIREVFAKWDQTLGPSEDPDGESEAVQTLLVASADSGTGSGSTDPWSTTPHAGGLPPTLSHPAPHGALGARPRTQSGVRRGPGAAVVTSGDFSQTPISQRSSPPGLSLSAQQAPEYFSPLHSSRWYGARATGGEDPRFPQHPRAVGASSLVEGPQNRPHVHEESWGSTASWQPSEPQTHPGSDAEETKDEDDDDVQKFVDTIRRMGLGHNR